MGSAPRLDDGPPRVPVDGRVRAYIEAAEPADITEQQIDDDVDGIEQLHADHDANPFSEYDQLSTIGERIEYRAAHNAEVAGRRAA